MLAWAVRADKKHKLPKPSPPVWDMLMEEIEATCPSKVILSAEAFSGARPTEVEEVKERLDEHNVSVVLYIREPLDYLRSAYKQRVKMGNCTVSFSRFLKDNKERVDYKALVARWARVFGLSNIHVRKFEDALDQGLLLDFAEVAGIDETALVEKFRSNVSPSDEIIRIVRLLNLVERKVTPRVRYKPEQGFFERVRRRLLRGGSAARMLVAIGRLIGMPPFTTENTIRSLLKKESRIEV